MLATRIYRRSAGILPIYPAGLDEAHHDSWAVCSYCWLHGPIHPKYVLWGCSLAILVKLLHLGDALLKEIKNYPKYCLANSTKLFAKYPCRAHRWGIRRGAQEAIWHHCEKLPRRVPNHHQLGPYKPGAFFGSAHRYTMYPKPAIYQIKLESWLVTEDDMVPMVHCQVLSQLCPRLAETVVFGRQQRLPCDL